MYVVVTTVEVEPGSVERLAELFDSTNRDLVAGHDDWIAAYFTANRSTNMVTVVAHWRQASSYEVLRSSAEFQSTMVKFAESFVGPPSVSVNEVLVEM
ncbi:MAG: antibiotic biosynthesis monooxygenase [Actinomycetia bacterium]|nr:antibiotic biosynthesis monooxygenase [Actinomycetes bacterium]